MVCHLFCSVTALQQQGSESAADDISGHASLQQEEGDGEFEAKVQSSTHVSASLLPTVCPQEDSFTCFSPFQTQIIRSFMTLHEINDLFWQFVAVNSPHCFVS